MLRIPSDRFFARGVAALTLAFAANAAHALTVFACEPHWAALVRELAPHAQVRSATHAGQDPHHIEARPSLLAAMRQADVALCTGASLEVGWLPMLQSRSGNGRVQAGAPGMLMAAEFVSLIDPRPGAGGSPFEGDVHPEGNPHFQLDPKRMLSVAEGVAKRLQQLDPARRDDIQRRWEAWSADWRGRIAQWERKAAPLRGMRVAAQHTTFAYLWGWLGIEQVADLEPRPGTPPSAAHLQRLLEQTRAVPPRAVVVATYQDARGAQWLAERVGSGVPVLQLPSSVTDDGPTATLAGLYDQLLDRLLAVPR
ncbi:metal ABC transporter substrate-binding protein [Piscinibacter koreensis]|uniref:Zinc ABC transporter substrate-binding protein n=1 Tax=Piscinibacter koreensis TaxID=2742824 RepID=A0A7Y6NNP9_9BURK|nr:zinc ABC transporter substrate-binding protein [Schlegelella koreensis]NUZ06474.1 zinc ABC transporter substrate-binding protein [Schlegelella koreensis]